jgi:hypothetical protein
VVGGGAHVVTAIFIQTRDHASRENGQNPTTLHVGDQLALQVMASWAIPYVGDVTDQAKFTVSDPAVGNVDDHGVFTARAEGKVTIEASFQAPDGTGHSFTDRMDLKIVK